MTNQNKDISVQSDSIQDNVEAEKVINTSVLISFGKNVRTKEVQNEEINWDEFINNFILKPKEHIVEYDNRKRDEKTFKFVYDNNKIVELDHLEAIKQLISIEKKQTYLILSVVILSLHNEIIRIFNLGHCSF